jgi:Ca-activated chloride channel homolog
MMARQSGISLAARQADVPTNTERYARINDNPFLSVVDEPLSTFSIDVDTASYSNVRRFLGQSQLPPADAVRIEEMVNYFGYTPVQPTSGAAVAIATETAPCPWNRDNVLVKVDLSAKPFEPGASPPKNLVFLVDVSGSMESDDKLPLLQRTLGMLADKLTARDRVSLVAYAGQEGLVLPSTPGNQHEDIRAAIENLKSGGSTNAGAGINLAYEIAAANYIEGGINRVLLATDGDFNVGATSDGELTRLIEKQRERGVFLTVLGFGTGNYNDSGLEQLSQHGNGNYAYIDSAAEAKRVLVTHIDETLTIQAKDVKVQVEFNPAQVGTYRLLGYENRLLQNQDFANNLVDAGDMGAGQHVTALYELSMASGAPPIALKYQSPRSVADTAAGSELLTVKVRYKPVSGSDVIELSKTALPAKVDVAHASRDLRFASSVAAFGMLLRDSPHKGAADFALVTALAKGAAGADAARQEFIGLVATAAKLAGKPSARATPAADEQ